MPAPTEQRAQDQRSDARKRIDAYIGGSAAEPAGGYWEQQTLLDLRDVLADADRDRQFAEAVRGAMDAGRGESLTPTPIETATGLVTAHNRIHDEHERIYGTPCTAKEKV